jgi:PadR family transcriptional regulator, regulatory protein PadR
VKGTFLGEFQELVMLAILRLDTEAYGVLIQRELATLAKRSISRGALHSALMRLEEKGLIRSQVGGATAERGGRRKRFYTVTNLGKSSLKEAQAIRAGLYSGIKGLSFEI